MLGEIADIFSGGAIGAITGLVGGWLSKREERKILEMKFSHEKTMEAARIKEMQLENQHTLKTLDKQIDIAEMEGQMRVADTEADAFVESIKNQAKQSGIWVVDAIKGIMRPAITVALLWITWQIYSSLEDITGGLQSLPTNEAVTIYKLVVNQILFLTVTAVAWWFASRGGNNLKAFKS